MHITSYPLGELQGNCYFLIQGSDLILIDPADNADFILDKILQQGLKLVGMFATHGHFDHIMAAGEITASLGVPLSIFKEDEFLVKRVKQTAKHFLSYEPPIMEITQFNFLKEGVLELGGFNLEVLYIPGHTPGSAAYYFKQDDALFSGDTLFKNAIGRYDFSYSDKDLLKQSLDRLLSLPATTIVYPGHEEITSIGEERNRDRFI